MTKLHVLLLSGALIIVCIVFGMVFGTYLLLFSGNFGLPNSSMGIVKTTISTPQIVEFLKPTNTPEPINTPIPTITPTTTSTPHPQPRTDINVCDVRLNDTFKGTYVKWNGLIMGSPIMDDDTQVLQVQTFSSGTTSDASCLSTFIVFYQESTKFYSQDIVEVTGQVMETAFEYEGATGTRQYGVIILADDVSLFQK